MDYIRTEADGQLTLTQSTECLVLPSCQYGFHNTETTVVTAKSGRIIYCHRGTLDIPEDERICSCGQRMHVNSHPDIYIRHLNIGGNLSGLLFPHNQLRCRECGKTKSQFISFKADGHLITEALHQYVRDLLAAGTYTNKQAAELTGLDKNVIKAIDKKRLQEFYTTNGGTKLIKPEKQAKYLGIDEFKLHNGRRYATHIIDLETGHVLWIQNGKKKQVVYDFIEHVGLEWMDGVEAVACDMNSDFQEAFEEMCPWIQPVFDYFHIVKNFNDKVVSEVRKDEQRRLYEEGNIDAARALKKTRYILMSNRSTLQKKDEDAASERVIHKGSPLFKTEDIKRKSGYEAKYDELLKENKLLFTLDLIKEKLSSAYSLRDEALMAEAIIDIIDICTATGNKHLLWFGKLLDSHFEGIIAHATYKISAGKIEGINQKIKTLRRHGYGYPDDEYFFLKIMDMSRKPYVRNQPSHKFID
ncbi:MAG: ISL3 family transposase [Lachnospiraceae bacterium]|nr:ISL3 family transposase [Lachnospiraceae bacterium]